jgi:hypothetical protein
MNLVAYSRMILVLMQRFTKITLSILSSYYQLNEVPFGHLHFIMTALKKELFVGNIEFVPSYLITIAAPNQPQI